MITHCRVCAKDRLECPSWCPGWIEVGVDVYVRQPARFFPEAVSITGPVIEEAGTVGAWVDGLVCVKLPHDRWWYPRAPMFFKLSDLGIRLGTPISQLSGRPGHPGYERFRSIAESWGYP